MPPRRPPKFPLALAAAALALLLATAPSWAQDAPPAGPDEEDRAEQIERHATKGLAALRKGNHDEALARMERLARLDPSNPLPRWIRARVLARTGKYAEALAEIAAAPAGSPPDPRLSALRYDLLRRLGRDEEVLTAARAAIEANPGDLWARTALGGVLEARGRRKEALAEYDAVIAAYNASDPAAEDLPAVAEAAVRGTRLSPNPADDMIQGAQRLLARRVEQAPDDPDALLALADLWQSYRGADGQAKAGKYYQQVLAANSEVAEARVGLARIALVFFSQDRATEACRRALATNPNLVPAMNLLARIHVGDGDYAQADAMWERARAVNPRDREARAVRAARLRIGGDREGFEREIASLLAEDPTWGRALTIAAELVGERQRRYDEAAELSARAIAVDPSDDQGFVVLGQNLMHLGRDEEARAAFEKAVEASKRYKDVVRDNYLQALEVLATFVTTKSERFVVRQHPSEAAVMEAYLPPLLEQAWKDLSAKYGFEPQGPIHVDSFHRHDDFSARSVGAPNIPALGVCFGRVITLDGPFARGVGEFSWARTAWHEFAHVVTLQMSKGQVPRWLTEGLSVHEEKARKPQWAREMDRELFDRWRTGRLLKMSEINGAFRGPDIMFAYFQGGLIADLIQQEWGFDKVTRMLRRFADDVPTEKVFEEVLEVPLADFDRRLSDYVGTLVGGYKMVPRWDEDSKRSFEERTRRDPGDAEAWTRLAWAQAQRGRGIDAGAALEKARALAPDAAEVILLEGELAMRANRKDLAERHYGRFLAAGHDDVSARLALARIALEAGKSEEAVSHYEAAKACFPRFVGKGSPYLELARLHEGAGAAAKAVAELEAYAAIAQEDFAVRRKLAGWYESQGDDAGLLRVSEEMVEIHPFGAPRDEAPDLELHRRWARALLRAGRKEEAAREGRVQTLLLRRIPEEDRSRAGAVADHLWYGDLLLDLGRAAEALDQALAALALEPENAVAKALKGRAQAAMGELR